MRRKSRPAVRRRLLLFVLLFPWAAAFLGATAYLGGPWGDLKARCGVRKFMVGDCIRVGGRVYEVATLEGRGYELKRCAGRECRAVFLLYGHEFEDYYETVPCRQGLRMRGVQ